MDPSPHFEPHINSKYNIPSDLFLLKRILDKPSLPISNNFKVFLFDKLLNLTRSDFKESMDRWFFLLI